MSENVWIDESTVIISLVIPCYNEELRLWKTIKKLKELSNKIVMELNYKLHVHFVDDGSTDNTLDILNAIKDDRFSIHTYGKNQGKGFAVRYGVTKTQGDIVWIADCDMAVSFENFLGATKSVEKGVKLVYGCRYTDGATITNPSGVRIIFGKTFNWIVRKMFDINCKDTQCPMKVIDGVYARSLYYNLETRGFIYDVEVLVRAINFDKVYCLMKEVNFKNCGGSSVNIFRDSFKMFLGLCNLFKKFNYGDRK